VANKTGVSDPVGDACIDQDARLGLQSQDKIQRSFDIILMC
jgi:hypothetical protein